MEIYNNIIHKTNVRVYSWGNQDKETVVFLHG